MSMIWIIGYIASITAVNVAFEHWPQFNWLWSIGVGSIFVTRDFCQRRIGHWVGLPMLIGLVLSYVMASPFVAAASAAAFAVSEGADWLIFTATKRPLRDRVLWSCAASAPLDSAVFLGLIGFLTPLAFSAQVASKMVAAVIVWALINQRKYA